MIKYIKDPNATLDFGLDYSEWLGVDTLIEAEWLVPTGLTRGTVTFTDTTATVWLGGGVVGEKYRVTCRIVTAGGRSDDRSIQITIKER